MNPDFSMPGSPDEPRPARELNHIPGFTIRRLIGEGGMGAVYEAEQDFPRRTVAIKLTKPGLLSEEALRRFRDEAEILAQLEHPGIARIYAAGTATTGSLTQPYLVMELVPGKPITHYASDGKLSLSERLGLFQRVLDAVQFAHQRGVIHRDLKPGNILVDAQGATHVLDFGIARIIGNTGGTSPDRHGDTSGTIAYMSPEQLAGSDAGNDTRADIYALGIIAYQLISGHFPYPVDGLDKKAVAECIRSTEPKRLATVDKKYRGDLDVIVARAMHKDRDQRYASVASLSNDIQRYLENRPVDAHPPSLLYTTRKFARRNKVLVIATAAVLVALVGGLISSSIGWSRARVAEQKAQRSLKRALDTIDQFTTFVTASRLDQIPGAAPVQERLLEDAVVLYEDLLEENKDNPEVKDELALALANQARFDAAGEDFDASQKNLAKRVAFLRELMASDPERIDEHRYSLARTLFVLTRVHDRAGNIAEAEKTIQESYELHRMILEKFPNDKDYRKDMAYLLGHWARMIGGDREEERYREALAMWTALQADYPEDREVRSARAWTEQRIAERGTGQREATAAPIVKPAQAELVIASNDKDALRSAAGKRVTVTGRVQEIALNRSKSLISYINFGRGAGVFSGIIHRNALPKFNEAFGDKLEQLQGCDVELTGIIDLYRDEPQLVLNQPEQIVVPDHPSARPGSGVPEISSLDMPALLAQAGRKAMVSGRVYDVTEHKGRGLTYIDFVAINEKKFAAIIWATNLNAVIRSLGGHPSVTVKGKTIRTTGYIYTHHHSPNMEISEPGQIEIID